MSVKTTASFLSSDGVHNVHVDIWRPEGDPCLRALFTGLAREGALHASAIRALLEQM